MSSNKLTRFPVTFHAYLPFPESDSDDIDEMKAEDDFTYTFNGRSRYFNEISYYYNQQIVEAHTRILQADQNCILAWADTLFIPHGEIRQLLVMNDKEWEKFCDTDGTHLPKSLILKLADRMGVHPAYFQPVATDPLYAYSYTMLKAIAFVAKDESSTEDDRNKSLKALETERQKFEDFSRMYPHESAYMLAGFAKARELTSGMIISKAFRRAHAKDIDMGIDELSCRLSADVRKERDFKTDWAVTLNNKRETILKSHASILFDDPEDALSKVIDRMRKIQAGDPNSFEFIVWGIGVRNNLVGVLKAPNYQRHDILDVKVSSDFERKADEMFCRPESVEENFFNMVSDYVLSLTEFEKLDHKCSQMEAMEKSYLDWKDSQAALRWHIPMFVNYKVAERVLGERQLPGKRPLLGVRHQTTVTGAAPHSFK